MVKEVIKIKKMIKSYKTELKVNNSQSSKIKMFFGGARFAYNWGLAKRNQVYKETKKSINAIGLHKELNKLKKTEFSWMYNGYSKCVFQEALRDLDIAFNNFFKNIKKGKKLGYPKFKRKGGQKQSCRFSSGIKVFDNYVQLPRLGKLKLYEKSYIPCHAHVLSATLSEKAGKFFVSIVTENEESLSSLNTGEVVGIDLGIKTLVTTSKNEYFSNPKNYQKELVKLKREQRNLSRKKKGGKNRSKQLCKLVKLHYRIYSKRTDTIHKITSSLTKTTSIGVIAMEDLAVKNMVKNHNLAKSIYDASFYEIRRQLEYKCKRSGKKLVMVDRFFPSSKTCSSCGFIKENLKLSERIYSCKECGFSIDRDLNAAINIKNKGTASLAETFTSNSDNAFRDRKLQVIRSNSKTGAYRRKRNKTENDKFL